MDLLLTWTLHQIIMYSNKVKTCSWLKNNDPTKPPSIHHLLSFYWMNALTNLRDDQPKLKKFFHCNNIHVYSPLKISQLFTLFLKPIPRILSSAATIYIIKVHMYVDAGRTFTSVTAAKV